MIYSGLLMLAGSCIVGGSTNTILPAIAEQYGWDVSFLRSMAGVGCMFVVAGTFVFGTLAKYRGPKMVNAISLILTAVAVAIYGFTSNLTLFVAILFILGFLSGGHQTSGANALVANWWPTKKGIVLGFVTMGIALMDVVWAPFIPAAYASFGVGPTMAVVGVAVLVLAIVGIVGTKNTPEEAGEYPDGDASNPENILAIAKEIREYKSPFTLGKMFKNSATWQIGIGMGLMYMVGMTFVASIIPRLLESGYDYHWSLNVLIVGAYLAWQGAGCLAISTRKSAQSGHVPYLR